MIYLKNLHLFAYKSLDRFHNKKINLAVKNNSDFRRENTVNTNLISHNCVCLSYENEIYDLLYIGSDPMTLTIKLLLQPYYFIYTYI